MANIELKNKTNLNLEDIGFFTSLKSLVPTLEYCHETIFNDVKNIIGTNKIYKRERFFPLVMTEDEKKLILRIFINKTYGFLYETEVKYEIYYDDGITLGFFSKYMESDDFVDDLNSVIEYIENI